MHLVLIETSGNQSYIFATNKLRENVGASQLTYLCGTRYVVEAVIKIHKENNLAYAAEPPLTMEGLREFLLDDDRNLRMSDVADESNPVEIVVATSGKAILLVKDRETGERIVGAVTGRALRDSPGLSVYGVVGEGFTPGGADLDALLRAIHEEYELVRSRLPGPEQRFLRFPFADACATSGFPAQRYERKEAKSYSTVSVQKHKAMKEGRARMLEVTQSVARDVTLPENLDKLEDAFPRTDWLAVIHADGNGLGKIFLNFGKNSGCGRGWRCYLDRLRRFSLALDVCTVNAYGAAVRKLRDYLKGLSSNDAGQANIKDGKIELPLLPLVLGGDDLTVICDGRYAVQFARDFLAEFERQTQRDLDEGQTLPSPDQRLGCVVPEIARRALGVGRLSSCAGVAVVKPHFPFHVAYRLAEELLRSAKAVKDKLRHEHEGESVPYPASAIDYHILYDASGVSFERLRREWHVDGGRTRLYARPYVVTPEEDLKNFRADEDEARRKAGVWLQNHHWSGLKRRVEAMRQKDETDTGRGRRLLPRSMLHDLREGLFMGEVAAGSRMALARGRYQGGAEKKRLEAFDLLLADPERRRLFVEDDDGGRITGFLDALDVVEFWRDEDDGRPDASTNGE